MNDEHTEDDLRDLDDLDGLQDLLRQALSVLPDPTPDPADDPPDSVVAGALWVHEWRTMDAALAELTFDSLEDLELAGVRSRSSLRELTFVSDELTIEIEVEPGPRTATVSGSVEPSGPGSVRLIAAGEVHEGSLDESGAFSIAHVRRGTVLASIETVTGRIRLGSFEI